MDPNCRAYTVDFLLWPRLFSHLIISLGRSDCSVLGIATSTRTPPESLVFTVLVKRLSHGSAHQSGLSVCSRTWKFPYLLATNTIFTQRLQNWPTTLLSKTDSIGVLNMPSSLTSKNSKHCRGDKMFPIQGAA